MYHRSVKKKPVSEETGLIFVFFPYIFIEDARSVPFLVFIV